jgi:hypothetical protein
MTSNANMMVSPIKSLSQPRRNNPFVNMMVSPIKSLSQPRRNNPFVKLLSSAASKSMRKLFNSSEGSIISTATETTQLVKHVRFSDQNCIRKTLSRMDYTVEECKASWLSREEGRKILRQCEKEVKKIDDGKKFKDKKFCARGLEGHTWIGSISKEQNRALAVNAVLGEQATQWEEDVFDEDAIAEIYYRASTSCQLRATLVGRRDHRAAEEIHGLS